MRLDTKKCRRSNKIFKMMAIYIQSRNADQCRSHHQKMQAKYNSLDNIIKNYHKYLGSLHDKKLLD